MSNIEVRKQVWRDALASCQAFRAFMVATPLEEPGYDLRRQLDPERDEWELTNMLRMEARRTTPRRSILKRLHGAVCAMRQRREWADYEAIINRG